MNNNYTAAFWKDKLNLQTHIEGGSFREVYRSDLTLSQAMLTQQHNGNRNASTAIYFLLETGQFSALHKIASDEVWHHYDGSPLCIYEIAPDGSLTKHLLGKDIANGEQPIVIIKAGSWFGSRVEVEDGYTLCGCTVAPGFDFADFELAERDSLMQQYPAHAAIIASLT